MRVSIWLYILEQTSLTSCLLLCIGISAGLKRKSPWRLGVVSLAVAVLCHMEADPEETFRMLDYLKGPAPTSPFEKQFIKERLQGKFYKSFSFFRGATPENGYTPQKPYTIDVSVNPYSFPDANWATVYVKSGGADSPRGIKLRCKPSTGQWFLNELQCLSDIRLPVEEDPWA